MDVEDEHLAYGSDVIAEEKSNGDPSRSPPSQPEVTESNAQLEELKAREIIDACRRRDIEGLQALAESPGGFIRDELRQQACEFMRWLLKPRPVSLWEHPGFRQGSEGHVLIIHRAYTARTTSSAPKRRGREGVRSQPRSSALDRLRVRRRLVETSQAS